MKLKSIQSKYLLLVLCAISISGLLVGFVCATNASRIARENSAQNMNLVCASYTDEVDASLSGIENTVRTAASYSMELLDSTERLAKDEDYRKSYTSQLHTLLSTVTADSEHVAVYYVRYAPELCSTNVGFLYRRNLHTNEFSEYPLTVIEDYEPDDVGHVGWYYIPINNYVENGTKISWLEPYYNENLHILMISCVAPLYKDGQLVGIVGMDIDFQGFIDEVVPLNERGHGTPCICNHAGRIYYYPELYDLQSLSNEGENGYIKALEKAGEQIYLQDILQGYDPDIDTTATNDVLLEAKDAETGAPMRYAVSTLSNTMHLVLSATESDMNANSNWIVSVTILMTIVLIALFMLVTVLISRSIIKPLRDLTAAADRIAQGDLDVEIEPTTSDEVGELATSFKTTASELKMYTERLRELAFKDALTSVRNATAYESETERVNEQIASGDARFAIGVFDMNDLKTINDAQGHQQGNKAITIACRRICNSFKHSPVFRIGGDEFVAVIEGADFDELDERIAAFDEMSRRENEALDDGFPVVVAKGIAVYDPQTDSSVADVFERADALMYENKTALKQNAVD